MSFKLRFILEDSIVDTKVRKDFVINDFIPLIDNFSEQSGIKVHVSGMPYVRTLNSQNIMWMKSNGLYWLLYW